ARDLRAREFSAGSDPVAEADLYLSAALYRLGRVNEGGAVSEASLAAQSARFGPGSETEVMARTMVEYATEFLSKQGRYEDAAAKLRAAVAILRRHTGVESNLAWALGALGRAASELKLF